MRRARATFGEGFICFKYGGVRFGWYPFGPNVPSGLSLCILLEEG